MKQYFNDVFPQQLRLLKFSKPNRVVIEHMAKDENIVFFGGPDWKNARSDLEKIPSEDRLHFIFSLFVIVLTDQALFTYFKPEYWVWREETQFPKFGWSGFGAHNENPLKVIWAAEREGIIDPVEAIPFIPGFASFYKSQISQYLSGLGIVCDGFLSRIVGDPGWKFSEGKIVPVLQEQFRMDVAR